MNTLSQSINATSTNVRVRVASVADAVMLALLRYEFRSYADQVIEEGASFVERCSTWMREQLHNETHWKCWIAESQHVPVGNVWAQLVEKLPNPVAEAEHYVYLTNFYVREAHRGHGIGSMLLSAALAWSKSRDAHAVILWPTERSKSIYLRHGYAEARDLMRLQIDQSAHANGYKRLINNGKRR